MSKALPAVLATLLAVVLQVAVAPHIAIGGAVPNFLLLLAVTISMVAGARNGAIAGFSAGLLFDLLGTGPIGAMALVLTLIGYLAGSLHEQMFAEGWRLPVTVVLTASLFSELAYWLVLAIHGASGPLGVTMRSVILPGAVYDAALALLVYPWLARFLRREPSVQQFRRLA